MSLFSLLLLLDSSTSFDYFDLLCVRNVFCINKLLECLSVDPLPNGFNYLYIGITLSDYKVPHRKCFFKTE